MRVTALPLVGILLLTVLATPSASDAQILNQVRFRGVVASIQASQETFVLQELGQGRTWGVRVNADTEVRRNGNFASRGSQAVFSVLRVGDVVDVEGFLVASNQLFARRVDIRSTAAGNGGRRDDDDDDDDDDDRDRGHREIRIFGVITAMDSRGQGILQVQEQSSNVWIVRLHPKTEVDVNRNVNRVGKGKSKGKGHRSGFGLLRVGDFIEVEGRLLGNRQIRAEEITVRSHAAASPVPAPIPNPTPFPTPFPVPFPNPGGPVQGQIVIHSPRQGAVIETGEFSVIGQTVPGAQVRIEVTARFGVLGPALPVTSGTVTADNNGFFTFVVRPPSRVPGAMYTIRVSSATSGLNAPPVSVTVRQQ